MAIHIRRNWQTSEQKSPYVAHTNPVAGLRRPRSLQIPIHSHTHIGNKAYWMDICGLKFECHDLKTVPCLISTGLRTLIKFGRLPSNAFRAPRTEAIFPIYTIKHESCVVTQHGPIFRHTQLSKVQEYLSDYLYAKKILSPLHAYDKLQLLAIHPQTLRLN